MSFIVKKSVENLISYGEKPGEKQGQLYEKTFVFKGLLIVSLVMGQTAQRGLILSKSEIAIRIKSRRTTRKYHQEPADQETIFRLLEIAAYAPSSITLTRRPFLMDWTVSLKLSGTGEKGKDMLFRCAPPPN